MGIRRPFLEKKASFGYAQKTTKDGNKMLTKRTDGILVEAPKIDFFESERIKTALQRVRVINKMEAIA